MVAEGMEVMTAANFGHRLRMTEMTAASSMTRGSYTLVRASTPVFSP